MKTYVTGKYRASSNYMGEKQIDFFKLINLNCNVCSSLFLRIISQFLPFLCWFKALITTLKEKCLNRFIWSR